MIYEVRTYQIVPRSLPEILHRFGEAYEHRKSFSELAAFWYTSGWCRLNHSILTAEKTGEIVSFEM